ncbi:MAG: glycosyltransferase family 4 protein [Anaerolineae bacterium]|nr:glycosyltransferase family 4 protein [Anaerolineae bacterium]
MHLILDARTATPHFPGIGRYVTSLAGALLPQLATNERLTVLYDAAYPQPRPTSAQFQAIPLNLSPFGVAQQWAIPRLLKQLNADLYHSPYYLMPYRPGVPTVLTVYDVIPLRFPAQSTLRARLLFHATTWLALRTANHVLAISEAARQDFVYHFHISSERITAIPLAADSTFCPQPPEAVAAVRARYQLPERFVLYLGSNKPHKNLVQLVEAFAQQPAPDMTLVIAGAWDARYPEARHRARQRAVDHPILWLGHIAEADLPALYAASTSFVFPSRCEGFGLPVLEALACGAPVVCANTASLPEVAGDAALYFDPDNVTDLATKLQQIWTNTQLRAALRAAGLRRAGAFSWEHTAAVTLAHYRELCA